MTTPLSPHVVPQGRRTRPKRSRLLLVLLFVLPFSAVEAWVRYTRDAIDLWAMTGRGENLPDEKDSWAFADAFSAWRNRPGSYVMGKSANSHGFISTPEIAVEKREGSLRLLFLGGSSTAGTGVNLPDEETWPWQVADLLRERFPGREIDFINGSSSGYSTFESYGSLWSRLRFFRPDVVVVYHGWNEMYYFTQRRVDSITRWKMRADGDWTLKRTDHAVARFEPLLVDHLLRWSQFLTKLRLALTSERAGELGSSDGALATDFDHRGLEIFRTNLDLIRDTSALIGAECFVAKQATLIHADMGDRERAMCRFEYHGFDERSHLRAYQGLYDVIDDEIRPERVIDCSVLSGQPGLWEDHVHPTPGGATAIAYVVADALEVWLRARDG